jgi:hypothetical protein
MTAIGKSENTFIYAKTETALGIATYPAGTDAVLAINDPSFVQEINFYPDEQKRGTLSELPPVIGRRQAGTFSFETYIKPSGALGTEPDENVLLTNAFGVKTATPATSVVYSLPAITADVAGMTIICKKDLETTFNFGCIVNEIILPVEAGQVAKATFNGVFLRQKKAGYTYVEGDILAAETNIPVDDCRGFETEAKVKFGAENNTDAGYTITAVSYTSGGQDYITITPGLAGGISDNVVCDGHVPAASVSGYPVASEFGYAKEANQGDSTVNSFIISATVTLNNNIKILDTEKNGSNYPTRAVRAGKREVTITIDKVFEEGDTKYGYLMEAQTAQHIELNVGNTAAYRFEIDLPRVNWESAMNPAGDEEFMLSRTGKAYASTSFNDEITLNFA